MKKDRKECTCPSSKSKSVSSSGRKCREGIQSVVSDDLFDVENQMVGSQLNSSLSDVSPSFGRHSSELRGALVKVCQGRFTAKLVEDSFTFVKLTWFDRVFSSAVVSNASIGKRLEWNEEFQLDLLTPQNDTVLIVEICDDGSVFDQCIGKVCVDLSTWECPPGEMQWIDFGDSVGQLALCCEPLWFAFPRCQLSSINLTVVSGKISRRFLRNPSPEFCNSYVRLTLSDSNVHTTPQCESTLKPVWNDTSEIFVKPNDSLHLLVELMNKEFLGGEKLAEALIDIGALPLQLRHVNLSVNVKDGKKNIGTLLLKFSASFLPFWRDMLRSITVSVIDADLSVKAKAVVKIELLGQCFRTQICSSSKCPVWNESFTFQDFPKNSRDPLLLKVLIFDDGVFWNSLVGEGFLNLDEIPLNEKQGHQLRRRIVLKSSDGGPTSSNIRLSLQAGFAGGINDFSWVSPSSSREGSRTSSVIRSSSRYAR